MNSFPSKILLFGEHIVNCDANALAIPYSAFYARLSFEKKHPDFLEPSNLILNKIAEHIRTDAILKDIYDVERLQEDIDKGMIFHLNIPVGYGLGSSGAIVASIYDRYAVNKSTDYAELKNLLGLTEGVFHGKSSGLDPLVSYLNQAVLINKETQIVENAIDWREDLQIFLLDTNQSRKTAPLVNAFLDKVAENKDFAKELNEEIIPLNNQLIENFLENKHISTLELVERLSGLQFENMQELILPQHLDIWLLGLASKDYFLKICGAGGGGFMLGFTKDKNLKLPFDVVWL